MSMEITEVHYDPDPKHIIITSDNTRVNCSTPVQPNDWLDGTLGETLCLDENQYMNFEKALCDGVLFDDVVTVLTVQFQICGTCGTLNNPGCCVGDFVGNAYSSVAADNCA